MLSLLLPFAAALAAALLLTPPVRRAAHLAGLVCRPSAERWSRRSVALLGGAAIFAGTLAGAAAWAAWAGGAGETSGDGTHPVLAVGAAATLMLGCGLADDRRGLRPAHKLVLQLVAGAGLLAAGVILSPTPWEVANRLATLAWFVVVTNALNLLDNMDGVAAGTACVSLAALSVALATEGRWTAAALCAAAAGAALGFLPFNFHPASIFMGDAGSLFLGALLAGTTALLPGARPAGGGAPIWAPLLFAALPLLDTLLVFVARRGAGRRFLTGGRDHLSHRLVALGLSERRAAAALWAGAALSAGAALLAQAGHPELAAPVAAGVVGAMAICTVPLARVDVYGGGASRAGVEG